jgi:hypothetical protein
MPYEENKMFGDGLEKEVIIKVLPKQYAETNIFGFGETRELDYERLDVWADKGLKTNFSAIRGVLRVDDIGVSRYLIHIDPRYNLKWVIAEVEAVAKTEIPKKPRKSKSNGKEALGEQE